MPAISGRAFFTMRHNLISGCCLALLITLLAAASVGAVDRILAPSAGPSGEAWHIVADELYYDAGREHYHASGQVIITQNNRTIQADEIRFEHQEMQLYASGNIIVQVAGDVLLAQELQLDLTTETGVLYDGSLFIRANHFYIQGDRIYKTGEQAYQASRACFTTCDGPDPAWKITARNLNVTIEGYGRGRDLVFRIKEVPVLYLPFMIFPVKTKRQSGLLAPEGAWSSRSGLEYTQPLYWAINEQSDATVYWHYLARRGHKTGLEYRYVPSAQTAGLIQGDYLHDRQVDDGSPETRSWGYRHNNLPRPNRDRWWLRMKHDQQLPGEVAARLDLDVVSDQDYLHEFRDGFTGFESARNTFYNTFGRDLDDYAQTRRANRLTVSRWWTTSSLNAQALWYDDVVARRHGGPDTTLQRLPVARLFTLPTTLHSSPLYYNMDAQLAHFYRKEGLSGQRLSVHPRLYLPWNWHQRLSLQPSVGWRGTAWQTRGQAPAMDTSELDHTQGQFDAEVDLASEVFRVYQRQSGRFDAIKHVLRPGLTYRYVPKNDPKNYPAFDDEDVAAARNRLTWSLTNTLIGRAIPNLESDAGPNAESEPKSQAVSSRYHDILRLYLEQSYYIDEPDASREHDFSDIYGQLRFKPLAWLALQADAEWSPHTSTFTSRNLMGSLADARANRVYVEHRYNRLPETGRLSEILRTGIYLNVLPSVGVLANYETNLAADQRIHTHLGVIYRHQCWSFDVRYHDEVHEQKYMVMFNLRGLGGIGGQFGADNF